MSNDAPNTPAYTMPLKMRARLLSYRIRSAPRRWLGRWVRGFKALTCRHRFDLRDQTMTGILPPLPPRSASPREWERYGRAVVCGDHPWHTHRVAWPCSKCGTVFYAHCGLDILAGRGTRNPPNHRIGQSEK